MEVAIFAALSLALLLFVPRVFSERTEKPRSNAISQGALRSRVIVSHAQHLIFSVLALGFVLLPTVLFVNSQTRPWKDVFSTLIVPFFFFSMGYAYFLFYLGKRGK